MKKEFIDIVTAMAHSPVHNYVVPGLTSQLVGGKNQGTVRLFTSERDTREWVIPLVIDLILVVLFSKVE